VARAPLRAVGLVLLSLTSRSCKESVSGSCSIGRGSVVLLSLTSRSCKESVSGSCSIRSGKSGSVVSHI